MRLCTNALSDQRLRALGATALLSLILLWLWARPSGLPLSPLVPTLDVTSAELDGNLQSKHLPGGVPGYHYFENVWANAGTFYLCGSPNDFPSSAEVLTGETFKLTVVADIPRHKADSYFRGTTLWVNEGGHKWHGLWHWYHFSSEDIIGGLAAVAAAFVPKLPNFLFSPWDTGFHGASGLNDILVRGIWGDNVVRQAEWEALDRAGEAWLFFDRIVFVDRWASHDNSEGGAVAAWNKMALGIFTQPLLGGFWEAARRRVIGLARQQLELEKGSFDARPPSSIAYVSRQQTTRRFTDEVDRELQKSIHLVADQYGAKFEVLSLENLSGEAQIQALSTVTVLVGIHGQGLTHLIWMPPNSTLIEVFPRPSFLRDYETVATVLGHRYHAIVGAISVQLALISKQNDTEITRAMWEADPGDKDPERVHQDKPVELVVPVLAHVLTDVLKNESRPPLPAASAAPARGIIR